MLKIIAKSQQASSKHGILYMITKYGYVHLFDIESGFSIFTVRISTDTVFITTEYTVNNGVLGINRSGQVKRKIIKEKFKFKGRLCGVG